VTLDHDTFGDCNIDRQRILQEDPETIGAWFTLVEDTKAKYGVYDNDVHNFNETGF